MASGNRAPRVFIAIGLSAILSTIGAMWAASRATPIAMFSVARSFNPISRPAEARPAGFSGPSVRAAMPEVAGIPLRYIVAMAQFDGDPDHQIRNQVRRELESLDPGLGIKVIDYDHHLSSQPGREDLVAARIDMTRTLAKALIGGSVRGAGEPRTVEMTIVKDARAPFDGVYSPADFRLPQNSI